MNRPLLLIDFPWTRDKDPRTPLGHASLLAALRGRPGLEVRSLIMPANDPGCTIAAVCERIIAKCDGAWDEFDIAIGVYVWSERLVAALLPELRRNAFGGRIILGGPQISYAGPGVERLYRDADVFVRGFAEAALCELAERPGQPRISGVTYRRGIDLASQAEVDLAALPSPWLTGMITVEAGAFMRWETQRGCPYRCSFCQHRAAGSAPPRFERAPQRLRDEIDLFASAGVGELAILDPVFNSRTPAWPDRPAWILESLAAAGFDGRVTLQCRPELVDARFLDACTKLDCQLEFGLQTTVASEWGPIRRGNKLERVDAALHECRARGIDHQVSLIFGLPGQTVASFERSVDWCLQRRVPVIKAFPLMLLRGTELEQERERWQLRETNTAMPVVCGSSSFDERDWSWMAQLSEALRRSEREHPDSIAGLRARARAQRVDWQRWTPLEQQAQV